MSQEHRTDHDEQTTARCERVLLTLVGDLGPWRERICLAGGLAPRYLIDQLSEGAQGHVGTSDVDLVIGLAPGDERSETYRSLQNNLERAHFVQQEPSFRWAREVEGMTVSVEFLCETGSVGWGRIFRPKGESTGTRLGAFNVRGTQLAHLDAIERSIDGERLDGGGRSRVTVRVANILPYTVLKTFAFQERHANKDAYDLAFTLLHFGGGPRAAGRVSSRSVVAERHEVAEAIQLLQGRFGDAGQDGPSAYATFLATPGDGAQRARLRQQAFATVREFLRGFREGP